MGGVMDFKFDIKVDSSKC